MSSSAHRAPLALLLAAGVLSGCSGGGDGGSLKVTGTIDAQGTGQQQTATIDMTDNLTFEPNVVRAKVGQLALTTKNSGDIPHNLMFNDSGFGSLSKVKGNATGTLTVRFTKAGTYRFSCTFHHGMDGEVVVTQ
jgi:plastocyanin